MRQCWSLVWLVIINMMALVISESYYTIIAPGSIKSNRKYTVAVTLHEADEPATIRVSINGPSYQATQDISVRPHETKTLEFETFKLEQGEYNITAEGISGIQFRNHSRISAAVEAGPYIYIQTDKAIYKPGDLVQFRVVMLDEHIKPLKIRDPIRIEIMDGKQNRIKQFKDIVLVKGVYTGKFQVSQYPVMGEWQIKVTISGSYGYSRSKKIAVFKYVLPKFSVYVKAEEHFVAEDRVIRATVYGKYTFDKYVEGYVTASIGDIYDDTVVYKEQREYINATTELEFRFDNPKDVENRKFLSLQVELQDKNTGAIHKDSVSITVHKERYTISVDSDRIQFRGNKPYRLKAKVTYWNDSLVLDHSSPVIMEHGSKEYSAYLDENSEALFEFEHERDSNHVFHFLDSTYEFPNIYVDEKLDYVNDTASYCKLRLKGDRPRLGTPLDIEVSSVVDIPYLVYIVVGHADIVRMEHIKVPPNHKIYNLQITPTIEMAPASILYVHYILDGDLHYDEMKLNFPLEFENQISVEAPKEARPGQEVTIDLKAQRRSYVSVLAVDISVYLLDSSYDLNAYAILLNLLEDRTYLPFAAKRYPGLLSGVLTFTNARYIFESIIPAPFAKSAAGHQWNFRTKFPETWIFQNYEITDGNTQLTLNIPDTITTWRITAFSVHEVTGFAMVKGPTDIVAIKPFFININLPYSVKRGEIVSIPITVFNYHNQSVDAEVVMYNQEEDFYFLDSNVTHTERGSEDQQRIQRIHVPANGVEKVEFLINPKQVGEISLRITAENPLSSDAVLHKLRVEPEGVVQHYNKALYISVPQGEPFKTTLSVDIPVDIVPSSEYVAISVGGDTLAPTLKNLNNLVLLPAGGGEQNMVNFAPNILVLNYLKASKIYSQNKRLVDEAKKFIEIGYQQQLSYRHGNGSYSVFGEEKEGEASTWLTAYTVRFFIKARKYLSIESIIIESGLEFLAATQTSKGNFPFTGFLFEPARQNRFGFTAFVLMAFLEDEKYATKFQSTIQKGLDFLNDNLANVKDIYALSIIATALQMAKHYNSLDILNKLHERQIQMPGLRWWSEKNANRKKDIEITAYILTAQLHTNTSDPSDDLLILKWLVEQRNERGGFESTHDTVVGLQALVTFSERYNNLKNINMKIQYAAKNNENAIVERNELTVDTNNVLVLQTEELPKSTRSIDIQVTGTGYSLVQLSYRYNMLDGSNFKHFQIQPTAKMLNADEMLLEVCFSYQQPSTSEAGAANGNMIIVEVNLPSGFTASDDNSRALLEKEIIQRIESKNSETTLIIYFAKLSADVLHCFHIMTDKIHDVMMRKPAAIIVYDYYNISRHDTAFYNIYYYTIIAPGGIKSNRKYTVAVTLHEADEPATIRVSINGPSYQATQDIFVRPHETKNLEFEAFKLEEGEYNITAEGISGIQFRNHSSISAAVEAGPYIYIQTDKAVYKPGDLVQFRVVMLDEHIKPLQIREPIHIEIMDGKQNRIKQFKDIVLIKGVYTGKFQVSQYPVTGKWQIKVTISGSYGYSRSKEITVFQYVLPKFSVYVKTEEHFVAEDHVIRATVYGKYTFDKYVEGYVNASIVDVYHDTVVRKGQREYINATTELEFRFDNPKDLENRFLSLRVELQEKNTGAIHKDSIYITVHKERYKISVDSDRIQFRGNKPYRLKAKVTYWNGSLVLDHSSPVIMEHGSKEYSAYLDENSEALFEFEHERDANHVFHFQDSTYKFPNIYVDEKFDYGNDTASYCKLRLKGDRPRLGTPLEIEVSSIVDIPYLVYIVVGHADIVRMEHIKVPPNQKIYTLQITPTIEMAPVSTLYVHYILDGDLHYDEMKLDFPLEFENQISVVAPKEARPGQEVTIDLKAQRRSYVSVLAVDIGVYLLDSSYDLMPNEIFGNLVEDRSYLPFAAKRYPGLLSRVLTFTNAHYVFEPAIPLPASKSVARHPWNFRKKFPETWIFQNYEITDDNTQLTLNIPDTITTWRITAFSVHEVTGFAMVKGPTDIVAIKPFFINLNLAYSVKRGEIVSIPITVFNYHNQSVDADVVMYNQEEEFYFLESNVTHTERGSEDQQRIQRIHVPANGMEKVEFLITPKQVGEISLRITAENLLSSDAILHKLRVEPEGVVQHYNKALYISVPQGEPFKTTLTVDIPVGIVPSSEYVAISVGGDTLVPTLKNLNNLVLLPTGGGEQNMVNFAPNILVLNYLEASKKYSHNKRLVDKAKKFIEIGYQQQLSYRHGNGCYSVFGEEKEAEASTWLTAYTVRFYIKARKYLSIESKIIESGLEFLAATQTSKGNFPFTGFLFEPAKQNRFGFTAFVLMAFLEDEKYAAKYESTIQKGLDFLNDNLANVKDIYALSIIATALQMAKHSNSLDILNKLHERQIQMPGLRWWSENNANRKKDIEITAYILTAQLHTNTSDPSDDLLILKWLVEQRNERGGFESTHDTVVGLQALVTFSERYNNLKNINMKIQYAAKNNENAIVERNELTVDTNNVLVLQTEELPKSTRSIDIQVTGTGYSLVQLSCRYNKLDGNNFKHFQIQPTAKMLNADEMLLEVCFSYQEPSTSEAGAAKGNLIIVEVNLPSGFTASDDNSRSLLKNEIIQRIESKNSETTLIIYFAKLSADIRHCFDIMTDRIHDVMMRKPAAIIVYDYYNISRYDTAFYNI